MLPERELLYVKMTNIEQTSEQRTDKVGPRESSTRTMPWGAVWQTNPILHSRSFGLTSELTGRAELWPSSRELRSHKELSMISIGARASKTDVRVGAISSRKLICAPEWTRRRPPNFDRCGSIFKSLKLNCRSQAIALKTPVRGQ